MIPIPEALGEIILPVLSELLLPEELLGLSLLPESARDDLVGDYDHLRLSLTVIGGVFVFNLVDAADVDNAGEGMPRSAAQQQAKLASDLQDAIAGSRFAWGQLRDRAGQWRAGH